jgi:nucleosome binding factor SPN SPT16 subunit
MKTITDDPVGFIENGGWTFLDPESDGEEHGGGEDDTDEEDDAYEPTDAETEGEIDKSKHLT